ncbi:metal-sulfur cluster biosynthetic enzyme [Brevibacterium ravenspurgense]|uniref:Metal-sulfur cluster biosynthetic enzyme n=1 Tax=Brevibacterium ravenspurgense TaxID=479117 RepID=A0A2I1IF55_9MICO|nr:metal-sulfur cluster assembly factor [Brevibacterium ravenspurgense]PKY69758.1 metal-sulfur cluster biosynthetic enzyme [Brevibacterium ravenspurgense]
MTSTETPADHVDIAQAGQLQAVRDALSYVFDPELEVDIVNLGLVYGIEHDADGTVALSLTLTTPECPLTDRIEQDIDFHLRHIVPAHRITWVWTPRWHEGLITEEGREMLLVVGYRVSVRRFGV